MVIITPKDKFESGFTSTGHTERTEQGADLVCASVSFLLQASIRGLLEYTTPSYTIEHGEIDVTLYESSIEVRAILKTLELALYDLQDIEPNHIKIIEDDGNE